MKRAGPLRERLRALPARLRRRLGRLRGLHHHLRPGDHGRQTVPFTQLPATMIHDSFRLTRMIKKPANGGLDCEELGEELEKVAPCNEDVPCPVDCILGEWEAGACSATCGQGTVTATRPVLQVPSSTQRPFPAPV